MKVDVRYGSDVVVDLLVELGIDYVAFNPGATFRGLHDSLVNLANAPGIIECLHEEISVGVAHGYAKATGRLMAAAVHDVVGLQHASMAIFNAWCDRVPVLVIGATGPMDASRRRPYIDWAHTAQVQANQVRDYTKWDDQPASLSAMTESFVRASQVATTAPRGPVYVCLDSVLQEEEVPPEFDRIPVHHFASPERVAPSAEAVAKVADWLVTARRPVIITDYVGREQHGVELLVELAETVGIPVVDYERTYNKLALNFPTQHPLGLPTDRDELLAEADCILGLDVRDLFGAISRLAPSATAAEPRYTSGARIAHVSMAPLMGGAWTSDYMRLQRADLQVLCEPAPFLEALIPEVGQRAAKDSSSGARFTQRRRSLTRLGEQRRREWRWQAEEEAREPTVTRAALALILDELTKDYERVVSNGCLYSWVHRLWDLREAHQYLGDSGGAGLGYGLSASIGVALAHQHSSRLVIDIQSDGDALYTPGALWTLAHHQIPLLIVMDNNRGYNNSVEHAERMATSRQRPVERRTVATAITDPNVSFVELARSFGVHAEGPVEHTKDLSPAIEKALEVVIQQRRPALIDVVTTLSPVGKA